MSTLINLQKWYQAQCNDDWEHQHGVKIDTIDNPGWGVKIDLKGTKHENLTMQQIKEDRSESDWIFCEIKDKKFIGAGDPNKLEKILIIFMKLVS